MSSLKRTAACAELDAASASPKKRARVAKTEELMLMGVVPSMTIPMCPKTSPEASIVNCIKQVLQTGGKSQKQIACECGLSQTKMSQFMNGAARTKGWSAVENKMVSWLADFRGQQKHLLHLQAEQVQKSTIDPVNSTGVPEVRVRNVYNPKQSGVTSDLATPNAEENCDLSIDWSPNYYSASFDSPNVYWESLNTPDNATELSTFDLELSVEGDSSDGNLDWELHEEPNWGSFSIGLALGNNVYNRN